MSQPSAGFQLVAATEEQDLEATKREWVEWGHPILSLDQFVRREKEVLGVTDFSKLRRRRWVLVPEGDHETLDFYSACETYRRPILLAMPNEPVRRAISYSICSVFVPMEKRKNGYATKMMTLLKQALSPEKTGHTIGTVNGSGHVATNVDLDAERVFDSLPYGNDATCSFLYSDVGEFYANFGWRVVGNRHVEWEPSSESEPALPKDAKWLSPEELATIGHLDRQHLLERLRQPWSAIRFALDDAEATSWRWLIKRSMFYADTLLSDSDARPVHFGLLLPGAEPAYAVWMLDFVDRKISLLRLRFSTSQQLVQLIGAVRREASTFHMSKVVAWNVELESLGLSLSRDEQAQLHKGSTIDAYQHQLAGGTIVERNGNKASLPALAFYADIQPEQPLEWVCNEYGWWC